MDLEGLVARALEVRDDLVACAEEIYNFLMPLKDKGPPTVPPCETVPEAREAFSLQVV